MDYCINEYSLHGQFRDMDDFCESMRTNTIPVLCRVREEEHSIVWNRNVLLQRSAVDGITLLETRNYLAKQNKLRSAVSGIRIELQKLMTNKNTWLHVEPDVFLIEHYFFDEEQQGVFCDDNDSCFYQAIVSERALISFRSDRYNQTKLKVSIQELTDDGKAFERKDYWITNCYDLKCFEAGEDCWRWWCDGMMIEVRPREYDYHKPHFHVERGECSAVYGIDDCRLYAESAKKLGSRDKESVEMWYSAHKGDLIAAWSYVHG